MTALVSLLSITMIPIDCKITKFSLYLYSIKLYLAKKLLQQASCLSNQVVHIEICNTEIGSQNMIIRLNRSSMTCMFPTTPFREASKLANQVL